MTATADWRRRIGDYLELVKFQHSVFALPFALTALVAAERGWPPAGKVAWILVAMVSARTAAMAYNRLVDVDLDRLNPRTRQRELPAGAVGEVEAATIVIVSGLVFVGAAWMLNRMAFYFSLPVLVLLLGYSFTKRFTDWCHLVLGLCLGLSPVGVWVALREEIGAPAVALGVGVMLWVAGFDIIYATLDADFDAAHGVHSMAQRCGIQGALAVARRLHSGFVAALVVFGALAGLGIVYFVGIAVIAALLVYEHLLVSPDDLSRVNVAFFTVNGLISMGLFFLTILDVWVAAG